METLHSAKWDWRGKLRQHLFAVIGFLSVASAGTTMSWTSPALPILLNPSKTQINITEEEGSWIGSLSPLGALVGALPAGFIADIMGRKWLLIVCGVPMIVSWIMIYFATNVWVLLIARFLSGISLGAEVAVAPLYAIEIAETSIRGILGTLCEVMIVSGIFYTNLFGAFLSYGDLCIVCGIVPVIFIALFCFAPESPIYLLSKHKREEARRALSFLRGKDHDLDREIDDITASLELRPQVERKVLNVMFKWYSVKAIIICITLFVIQQLCGVNAVTYYTDTIFVKAGNTLNPYYASMIVTFSKIFASLGSSVIVERAGRRLLLMVSAFTMSLTLVGLGLFFHLKTPNGSSEFGSLPIIFLVLYEIFFGLGFGTIPWVIPGEILPNEIKGLINGLALTINWLLAFFITKEFPVLVDAIGAETIFWSFGGFCVLGGFFVMFFVFETKGKSFQEIQNLLKKKLY